MGGICNTHGGIGGVYTGLRWENVKERDYPAYTGVDVKMILRWELRK